MAIDTVVEPHEFSAVPVEGDNIINPIGPANGVVPSGTTEAGSTVSALFAAIGSTAMQNADADSNRNWTVTFTSDDIPGDQYDANVTIAATDVNGNTNTFAVDTVAPDAAAIVSATLDLV